MRHTFDYRGVCTGCGESKMFLGDQTPTCSGELLGDESHPAGTADTFTPSHLDTAQQLRRELVLEFFRKHGSYPYPPFLVEIARQVQFILSGTVPQ